MKRIILMILMVLALAMPVLAQDEVASEPATELVAVIDAAAPWVIIVVLLLIAWRQRDLIPQETVREFLERASANAALTQTKLDDVAVEAATKAIEMLYADAAGEDDNSGDIEAQAKS